MTSTTKAIHDQQSHDCRRYTKKEEVSILRAEERINLMGGKLYTNFSDHYMRNFCTKYKPNSASHSKDPTTMSNLVLSLGYKDNSTHINQ